MQKNLPDYAPPWIRTVTLWAESSHREVRYALCDDWRTLLWFANQRAVEYHPTLAWPSTWTGRRTWCWTSTRRKAGEFGRAVAAAKLVRQALADAGLAGAVKTSGAKGVHVYVPVRGRVSGRRGGGDPGLAARAERLDPASPRRRSSRPTGRKGVPGLDPGARGDRGGGVQPAGPARGAGLVPGAWDDLDAITPADFTVHGLPVDGVVLVGGAATGISVMGLLAGGGGLEGHRLGGRAVDRGGLEGRSQLTGVGGVDAAQHDRAVVAACTAESRGWARRPAASAA
jgi:bifunctional non-homologous end joining protein LigD